MGFRSAFVPGSEPIWLRTAMRNLRSHPVKEAARTRTGDFKVLACINAFAGAALLIWLSGSTKMEAQAIRWRPSCGVSKAGLPPDVYIPMDSWIYPAMWRLHALGHADSAFLGIRPWTRRSLESMLSEIEGEEDVEENSQAQAIITAVKRELRSDQDEATGGGELSYGCEQIYSRLQGIHGLTLRDSYHLGQTISNDYGRPYQPGFNTVDGAASSAEFGRFSLYVRGEYQHAPGAAGYSAPLVSELSGIDGVPLASNPVQATIPAGPIPPENVFRLVEANLSYRILNHEISLGKSDHWLASTDGGAFMYSTNAENIYAFQIDRTEPLFVPFLSWLVGPFRYAFLVGSLKGHSDPNAPWLHVEKVNFKPTPNVEFGFERSVIWGGKGHGCLNAVTGAIDSCNEPITLHTFLKSFFSTTNTSTAEKYSRDDPGARFSSFEFNWRLPWLNHWLTLYTDSVVHDDVNPIDAPRHAGVRPGLYLARIPGIPRLDLRVEGVNTDPATSRSTEGDYLYTERVQVQGYTNKGYIIGDSNGREGKGGQAWLTYHLSPKEMLQLSFKHNKAATDFIRCLPGGPCPAPGGGSAGGTTQNNINVHVVKRVHNTVELSADVQHEWWKAPLYKAGLQSDIVATFQITIYPKH